MRIYTNCKGEMLPIASSLSRPLAAYFSMTDGIQTQARSILDALTFSSFDQCLEITRNFNHLPPRPGIYAIRHRHEGLPYLGKTNQLKTRFSSGHKAFTWAWLDHYKRCQNRYHTPRSMGKPQAIIGTRIDSLTSN